MCTCGPYLWFPSRRSWGTPKFAPSTRPTWRYAGLAPSRTGRAGLSAAPIVRDFGLCLPSGAHRLSEIGRGQLSTGDEGGLRNQRGASHTGFSGRARLTGRLPLRSGAPRAAGGPDATGDAPIACQLPEPGPVDSGRWAQDSTPPHTHTPTRFAATERECGVCVRRARCLALPPLPNPPLESSPKQSWRLKAAPTGLLPGAPGAPALRSELPGL